jgi:hypothetical protein
MLKAKHKIFFQRFTLAAMIFAMFGFGIVRWFRLENSPRHNVTVTYDSNLHDHTSESKPVLVNPPTYDVGIKEISNELDKADEFLRNGQDDQSVGILNKAESDAYAIASDKMNPRQKTFQTVEREIINIRQNVKSGQSDNASREIEDLIKVLDAESQKK